MKKPKDLIDILTPLIEAMTFPIIFESAEDNNDGTFTLHGICDLHHAQIKFPIVIDGKNYIIEDYGDENGRFFLKVSGTDAINVLSFDLYKPFFFHGTPIQQEAELVKVPVSQKTPMIYLIEQFAETFDENYRSSIERKSVCQFCFLTNTDKIGKDSTDTSLRYYVKPMENLAHDFIEMLQNNPAIFYTTKQTSKLTRQSKFGIYISGKGTDKLYMAENLSGVVCEITLEIYEDNSCCEEVIPTPASSSITADFTANNLTPTAFTDTVQFTDTSTGNPDHWSWDFGDGTTSEEQNPTHIFTTSGTKTITLIAAKNGQGDFETKTNYIDVQVGQDPLAVTFANCAGIVSQPRIDIYNNYISSEGGGAVLQANYYAIYPFDDTSLLAASKNMLADFCTQYALTLNNFILADLTNQGLQGDGATKHADTSFIPHTSVTDENDFRIEAYIQTNFSEITAAIGSSSINSITGLYAINNFMGFGFLTGIGSIIDNEPNATAIGFYSLQIKNGTIKLYKNGVLIKSSVNANQLLCEFSLFILANNNGAGGNNFSSQTISYSAIGKSLGTDAEHLTHYNNVKALQVALGRLN